MAARRGSGFSPATNVTGNKFSNDGSFLEMFKKQMEQKERLTSQTNNETDSTKSETSSSVDQESPDSTPTAATEKKPVALPTVGKRKGANRALKTGIVAKKPKPEKKGEDSDGSAWSKYLAEVNEYKSKMCMDEDKSRPLVK
ncbi:telomerase RNA component interacting RNase-like [Ylistrum balloti]|uniref:telomerase RNA component interacting RNase-like n=1 Tax=Ylistrum balloti TaxID=509963 RepID=UPI002905A31B|nr:telomerase RNA component interacting RNase-like [Ylistrum balloti]XP_060070364.1 telomerase RNA component interacting RNase-like [Ylistrum balloti]